MAWHRHLQDEWPERSQRHKCFLPHLWLVSPVMGMYYFITLKNNNNWQSNEILYLYAFKHTLRKKRFFSNDFPFLVYDFLLFQMGRFTIKCPITRSLSAPCACSLPRGHSEWTLPLIVELALHVSDDWIIFLRPHTTRQKKNNHMCF